MSEYNMKPPQRRGSPLKYAFCTRALKEDELYSAACIVAAAIEEGLLDPDDRGLHMRVRSSFNKIKNAREFPQAGHGMVRRIGQRPVVGYFGRLWMDAVDYRTFFSGPGSGPNHSPNSEKVDTNHNDSDLPF